MEITRVFELIQSVFDAHEDWISKIKEFVEQQDYQSAIDQAYKMFKNPIVLFDANNKVLGRTRAYGEHELDNEWAYLCQYGYSSVNAINMIKFSSKSNEFYSHDKVSYTLSENNIINLGGTTLCIYFNNVICGRINLIAKERRLNQGDMQLLQQLAEILRPALGQSFLKEPLEGKSSVFLNVMMEKPYDPVKLDMQLKYMGWHCNDVYYVTLIRFKEKDTPANLERKTNSLMRMLMQNLRDIGIYVWNNDLILLSTKDLSKDYDACALLRNVVVHNPVCVGFSLPDQESIKEISTFYRQAAYALKRGMSKQKQKAFQYFENYAVEYLLIEKEDVKDKVMAVMPAVYRLWKEKQKGDEMFRTLLCFLDHERSIAQTSAELFMHRNTTVYRIKKIQENMRVDLDDAKMRNYCYISMHFLDALEKMSEMM